MSETEIENRRNGAAMSEWRPMNTAPRDGTHILWCVDNGEYTRRRWSYCVIWWPEFKECFLDGRWQPLSDPPSAGACNEGL